MFEARLCNLVVSCPSIIVHVLCPVRDSKNLQRLHYIESPTEQSTCTITDGHKIGVKADSGVGRFFVGLCP